MTKKKQEYGVRTLECLRGRCIVDDETECWLWQGAMTLSRGRKSSGIRFESPTCAIPIGLFGNEKHRTFPALRLAWLLAGKEIPAGHIVYRAICSQSSCVNPTHARCGTRKEAGRLVRESGRLRGDPLRCRINMLSAMRACVPVETVRAVEADYSAGMLQRDVRQKYGIGQKAAKAIRIGSHPNSLGRDLLVPQASVFSWAMAA